VALNLAGIVVEQNAAEPDMDGAFRVSLAAPALRDTVPTYTVHGAAATGSAARRRQR
jgi:hypothetical protein